MTTLNDLFKKSEELKMYYEKSNDDIKRIMLNVFNASFRFGLTDNQTIYMIDQAIKPLKTDLLIGMIR